jgi:hypothetical protein
VKLAPNHSSLDEIIEAAARGIALHKLKKDMILGAAPLIAQGFVSVLADKCKKFQVDAYKVMDIYEEQFESDAAKLGNLDATYVIDKWVNNKITISEYNTSANGGTSSDPAASALIDALITKEKMDFDSSMMAVTNSPASASAVEGRCTIS